MANDVVKTISLVKEEDLTDNYHKMLPCILCGKQPKVWKTITLFNRGIRKTVVAGCKESHDCIRVGHVKNIQKTWNSYNKPKKEQ